MKFLFRLSFVVLCVFFYQCDDAPKKKEISKKENLKSEKIIEKDTIAIDEEKKWNTINSSNTEDFLLAYGKENPETKVIIKTKFGNIKIRLFEDVPAHRASFIYLTKNEYFNTTVIYRVAKNFVIQGGNSDNYLTVEERTKHGNYLIKPEFKKHRIHKYGSLAAAREWDNNPNKLSNPFEFYVVQNKKGAPHLDNQHTVFGEVFEGFDTMTKISKVEVGADDWPMDEIPITVEILE
ncbi:peptidylprolyl isomerase [Polaribacter vadi]|uniref:Peptidyl-prolyl cis-trans isomerase n=1 Tax=Polaribacter vadi TaxID=1774273 RepID=A0A1B8TYQ9_9FLAO|nr:peptidylprolyl isomerase [Polaribacter vadi]AOW18994.1 peptidylprolyl isomerase [Polaribacter vadi]OBY64635.1 peptidylprolyl isomerase [Polaribacter vadi]